MVWNTPSPMRHEFTFGYCVMSIVYCLFSIGFPGNGALSINLFKN